MPRRLGYVPPLRAGGGYGQLASVLAAFRRGGPAVTSHRPTSIATATPIISHRQRETRRSAGVSSMTSMLTPVTPSPDGSMPQRRRLALSRGTHRRCPVLATYSDRGPAGQGPHCVLVSELVVAWGCVMRRGGGPGARFTRGVCATRAAGEVAVKLDAGCSWHPLQPATLPSGARHSGRDPPRVGGRTTVHRSQAMARSTTLVAVVLDERARVSIV
jgi:hypothetical protein